MNDNKDIGAHINNTTPLVQEKAGEHSKDEQPIEPKECFKKCSTFTPLLLIILIGFGIGIGVYLSPTDSKGMHICKFQIPKNLLLTVCY